MDLAKFKEANGKRHLRKEPLWTLVAKDLSGPEKKQVFLWFLKGEGRAVFTDLQVSRRRLEEKQTNAERGGGAVATFGSLALGRRRPRRSPSVGDPIDPLGRRRPRRSPIPPPVTLVFSPLRACGSRTHRPTRSWRRSRLLTSARLWLPCPSPPPRRRSRVAGARARRGGA